MIGPEAIWTVACIMTVCKHLKLIQPTKDEIVDFSILTIYRILRYKFRKYV